MKTISMLMQEHRRIEKIVDEMKLELQNQQRTQTPNTGKILSAIDFFETYADLTHHGKEENIFFEKLQNKELTKDHNEILQSLLDDHEQARLLINQLRQETESYRKGEENVLQNMSNTIQKLTILYTGHIKKEDEQFFKPVMQNYFSEKEQDELLNEFYQFDQKVIHKKYEQEIEHIQNL